MQALTSLNSITFKAYRGAEIAEIIEPLGQLRIDVFREYPYLYDGDLVYEQNYLSRYAKIKDSLVLMAFESRQIIGATTATPLIEEFDDFRTPYENAGINVAKTFYFGEAMLRPAYRGMGIYKTFMHERTQAAIRYGATTCTFLAVMRPDSHPLKPDHYQDLKPVWNHYGFVEYPEIQPQFLWKDIDQQEETQKPFTAWLKVI
jgi:GNAT superfamily N-acetyltransferase